MLMLDRMACELFRKQLEDEVIDGFFGRIEFQGDGFLFSIDHGSPHDRELVLRHAIFKEILSRNEIT